MPKVSSNPTECVAIVYLLQIARENDVCKCGRELVGYANLQFTLNVALKCKTLCACMQWDDNCYIEQ